MDKYTSEKQSFEGFETWLNAFKMKYKMHSRILLFLVLFVLAIFVVSTSVTYNNKTDIAGRWVIAKTIASIKPSSRIVFEYPSGKKASLSVSYISKTPWIRSTAKKEIGRLFYNLLKTFSILLFYPLIILSFKNRSSKQSSKKYIRGAKLDTAEQFYKKAKERKEDLDLPFGGLKQPRLSETTQMAIFGQPGSGKTVCLNDVIDRVKHRGDKAIIHDYKGDYLSKFYDPETDLIFNPLDRRSLGWNIFNDLRTKMDIDANVASLIPDDPKEMPFWAVGARTVFSGIIHNLYQENTRSNRDIWQAILEDAPQLINRLNLTDIGQAGQRFIGTGESNQSLGIIAKLIQHTLCFNYMANNDGDFSVIDWLNDGKPGTIFITNYADLKDTLKPILTLFIDLVGRKLLSMPDSRERRLFMFLDEFNTLQRMPTIVDLLTGSRSKGGCVYIAAQDYGKIDHVYTKPIRQSIVNACSNSVIFSLSDEAAETASKGMFEVQFMESTRTYNMGVKDWRDGISLNEKKDKEPLIFPSEIEALPTMTGVVKFNNYNRVKTTWHNPKDPKIPKNIYPDLHSPFEIRDDLILDNLYDEQQRIMQQLEDSSEFTIIMEPPEEEEHIEEG
jgi:type IV secretory pathway TraG/TraD family ATPase VirD4